MDLFSLVRKPIQAVRDAFDLNGDLGSTALITQFAAIKCQLAEVKSELYECRRLSREKDALIARLQDQAVVQTQAPKSGPALVCQDETYSPDAPPQQLAAKSK